MRTENHIRFSDELVNKTGFYLWIYSLKCKNIRIGFYIAMLVSAILTVTGFLRHLVLKTDWTMTVVFLLLTLILFAMVILVWPLVFRSKAINAIKKDIDQIVTMDENHVNLHTALSHQQYKWHIFTDIEDDERYYFLFSPEVYIILDKRRFPKGGEDIFLEFPKVKRLLKEDARKPKKEKYFSKYYMLFTKDYLTPLVYLYQSVFQKKDNLDI